MTIAELMDLGWCRGFTFNELCDAARATGTLPPTQRGYLAHCSMRDQELDDFFDGLAQAMDDAAFAPPDATEHNAHVRDYWCLEVGIPM